ncbi:hypothetical protein [Chitinophaga sp.]|uniref:hypothetical protein n=1 Tax=Chitinophaga sp. TaxID=1869181 RepID=UPI0031CF415A
MKTLELILEKTDDELVGRVIYEENLIIDEASSLESLEKKIKKHLSKYHNLPPQNITFEYTYDLSVLFETFNYLKISTIAEIAGINPSLLRQYVTGRKNASAAQAQKIEVAIHRLGRELTKIHVYGK